MAILLPLQPYVGATRTQAMRFSIPSFPNYLDSVKFAFGEDYFSELDRRIARRRELRFEFLDRSRNATTKALKAMWKNLSKGHLHYFKELKNEKRRSVFFLYAGYIAYVALFVFAVGAVVNWAI